MPTTITWPVSPTDPACNCPPGFSDPIPVDLEAGFGCEQSALTTLKNAMLLDTAEGRDLNRIGSMFLIPRSIELGGSDFVYRRLIQLLAFSPKQVLKIVYDLLGVLFGTQDALIANGKFPWKVFEVFVNEIIVEIPLELTTAGLPQATYLHGLAGDGNGFTTGSATQLFVFSTDDFTKAASNFVGLTLTVDLGGTLTDFTLTGLSYDPVAKKNTFTVPGGLPINTNGLSWRVLIPANVSFIGDYFLNDASNTESSVDSNIVVLFGEGLIDLFNDLMTNIVKASGIKVRIERI